MKFVILSVVAAASLGAVAPALAQEAGAPEASGPIVVIRPGDAVLTCPQISDEAAGLSQTMGGEPDGGLFGRLGSVAAAGAAMVIPGAGLVIAGTEALTAPERERREAEAAAVRHRWYYLNGLYAGLRCHQRAEAVESPAPATSAATAPAPVQE